MKWFFCIAVLCLWFSPAGAQLRVGNHGDGVFIEGNVYLRDLYEANQHLEPWIGDRIDGEVEKRVSHLWRIRPDLPPVDRQLFARKISDLERIFPNLGTYVLGVLENHRWLVGRFLPLHDDERPGRHALVGLRHFVDIEYQRDNYLKMPQSNRVAFLLHEAFSSLLPRKSAEDDEALLIRLVQKVFTRNAETDPALRALWARILGPETVELAKTTFSVPQIHLVVWGPTGGFARSSGPFLEAIDGFCESQWKGLSKSSMELAIRLDWDPFFLVLVPYQTDFGHQFRWAVTRRSPVMAKTFRMWPSRISSAAACRSEILRHFDSPWERLTGGVVRSSNRFNAIHP